MATLSLLRFSPLPLPLPLPKTVTLSCPRHPLPLRRIPFPIAATHRHTSDSTPATSRIFSAICYTLPFVNALHYGRFAFAHYTVTCRLTYPFLLLLALYCSAPLATILAFFALYLGVVQNPAFPRYVRFNAMQAVVLDVFLTVPVLVQRVVGEPTGGVGLRVMEWGYNGIFTFVVFCFVYSFVSCVMGRTPYLPAVASIADRQL